MLQNQERGSGSICSDKIRAGPPVLFHDGLQSNRVPCVDRGHPRQKLGVGGADAASDQLVPHRLIDPPHLQELPAQCEVPNDRRGAPAVVLLDSHTQQKTALHFRMRGDVGDEKGHRKIVE